LLAHVQVCADCAAWLARTRHTDVLLKGVGQTHPSDRVRNAILDEVRAHSSKSPTHAAQNYAQRHAPARPLPHASRGAFGTLRLASAGLLLRFDLTPARVMFGLAASFIALLALSFYLNLLPPVWSYTKLGFEYQPDSQAALDTTPIPISAITSGQGGVGGPVAVPNLLSMTPANLTQEVALDTPLRVRFDQPMDRASVESALRIDPPAAGTFGWDADNEVRFTPASPGLLRGITYTVSLTTTALSMAGTPLKERIAWSFSTLAAHSVTPLPPDGSVVAPTVALGVQFDAPMERVNAGSIVALRHATTDADVPVEQSWDAAGTLLSIRPTAALSEGY
jgi:hypothetical protein